ncbi:hypothetical protein RQP46_005258 [Phenoliferia psychrophenolica]
MTTVQDFDKEVKAVVTKGKLSPTVVQSVVDLALSNISSDAHLISTLFRAHKKALAPNKLVSLYLLDAIAREARVRAKKALKEKGAAATTTPAEDEPEQGQEAKGTPATFLVKVEGVLSKIVLDCWENGQREHREKVRKVLDIWTKAGTFSATSLARISQKLLALSTDSPAAAPTTTTTAVSAPDAPKPAEAASTPPPPPPPANAAGIPASVLALLAAQSQPPPSMGIKVMSDIEQAIANARAGSSNAAPPPPHFNNNNNNNNNSDRAPPQFNGGPPPPFNAGPPSQFNAPPPSFNGDRGNFGGGAGGGDPRNRGASGPGRGAPRGGGGMGGGRGGYQNGNGGGGDHFNSDQRGGNDRKRRWDDSESNNNNNNGAPPFRPPPPPPPPSAPAGRAPLPTAPGLDEFGRAIRPDASDDGSDDEKPFVRRKPSSPSPPPQPRAPLPVLPPKPIVALASPTPPPTVAPVAPIPSVGPPAQFDFSTFNAADPQCWERFAKWCALAWGRTPSNEEMMRMVAMQMAAFQGGGGGGGGGGPNGGMQPQTNGGHPMMMMQQQQAGGGPQMNGMGRPQQGQEQS